MEFMEGCLLISLSFLTWANIFNQWLIFELNLDHFDFLLDCLNKFEYFEPDWTDEMNDLLIENDLWI